MGSLRLLLALSVVFAHSYELVSATSTATTAISGVGGVAAVEIFFAVSGFYMAMVLSAAYKGRKKAFYLNRALRIFPEYWVVMLASLMVAVLMGNRVIQEIVSLPSPANFLLAFSNLGIFGTDSVFFVQVSSGALTWGPFGQSDPLLHSLLLLPQAWTLALELVFYLIAPWLVRLRSGVLLAVVVLLLATKYALVCGIWAAGDPWTYRFVGFEVAFFVLGILMFRAKERFFDSASYSRRPYALIAMTVLMAASPFIAPRIAQRAGWPVADLLVVLAFVVLIPRLFHESEKWKFDQKIGGYSYPIYLSHLLAILLAGAVFQSVSIEVAAPIRLLLIYGTAILVAYPLVRLADLVDVVRRRVRVAGARATGEGTAHNPTDQSRNFLQG